ncbi:MAG: prepilin-type N-terminal cleavage/methylation domain-containing protein [Cyanobacteria bacterium M_surface_10_m2_119]|nr:prepilin-type N-terminal cleavage/methylation domain-containing protein [Cyanobacteria bacterium M_surface_10_m2_119]
MPARWWWPARPRPCVAAWCWPCPWACCAWASTPASPLPASAVSTAVLTPRSDLYALIAMVSVVQRRLKRRPHLGFSLPELLIALLLGGGLAAVLLQLLVVESGASQTLGRLLRERQLGQRALELVRQELQQAQWASTALTVPAGCSLAGRTVVLQLGTPAGGITYSVGASPSPIWRGRVLMRCGPAYGLSGELASTAPQNRVLIDALPPAAGFCRRGADQRRAPAAPGAPAGGRSTAGAGAACAAARLRTERLGLFRNWLGTWFRCSIHNSAASCISWGRAPMGWCPICSACSALPRLATASSGCCSTARRLPAGSSPLPSCGAIRQVSCSTRVPRSCSPRCWPITGSCAWPSPATPLPRWSRRPWRCWPS